MMRAKSSRVQFSLASAVSLLVHALLVLLLYQVVAELRHVRRPPLVIVSRETNARTVVLPELAVRLESTPTVRRTNAMRHRPEDVAAAMPRRTLARDELLALKPYSPEEHVRSEAEFRPREAVIATLPVAVIETPVVPQGIVASPSDLPAPTPRVAPLPRSEHANSDAWLPVASPAAPRIASLPTTGTSRRPVYVPLEIPGLKRPPSSARTRQPAAAFAHRRPLAETNTTHATIARGLEFLARVQLDDGRWRFDYLRGAVNVDAEPVNIRADAAATGLALLVFLGAGHDHFEGPYAAVVDDGLHYLVRVQRANGEMFPEDGQPAGQVARFYSHGIATLAVCEAFGMTGDPALYGPAERALDHLAATQHPEHGGWRYMPGVNADLSVTGWQTAALRSGELAGLTVRRETFVRVGECLEMCRDTDGDRSLFRYNPWASASDPLTRHGLRPSTVMTAVGLTTEFLLDAENSDPQLQRGGEHLAANLPENGTSSAVAATGTLGNPLRDTYYWYYGTQAMYYLGGAPWQRWSRRLERVLVDSQETKGRLAGSWDPLRPVPDKWAAYGGRLYVTAMNLLSLEIENRHLRFDAAEVPQIAERDSESPH